VAEFVIGARFRVLPSADGALDLIFWEPKLNRGQYIPEADALIGADR
jgi:hypothetical protein